MSRVRRVAWAIATGLPPAVALGWTVGTRPGHDLRPQAAWVGAAIPDPQLGFRTPPNSHWRALYATNPYSTRDSARSLVAVWQLQEFLRGSVAPLRAIDPEQRVLRVDIQRIDAPIAWHVQVNQPELSIVERQNYTLSFRVRADSARPVSYGVSLAHAPWNNVGLYSQTTADTAWRTVRVGFKSTASDANVRIHFDLGESHHPVELADVTLHHDSTGVLLQRALPAEYAVDYRFDAQGCRGPDRAPAASTDRQRIVVLGDAFALGVGLREDDTFASQLERLANAERPVGSAPVDVINCAVPGWGTREERLFYEQVRAQYPADLLIIAVGPYDDRRLRDDVLPGYLPASVRYERTSLPAAPTTSTASTSSTSSAPSLDTPRDIAADAVAINATARAAGSRVLVALFRTDSSRAWFTATRALQQLERAGQIPVVDLGVALLARRSARELMLESPHDGHPNERAHRIAADTLWQIIRARQLLPGTSR